MSERLGRIRPAEPARPRESAVGIVAKRAPSGAWRVLVGRRSRRSRFMPGHWAFLGGAVEPADRPEHEGAHVRCAAREMAEETGIEIPPDRWLPAGLLVTPPMYPIRYRTEFFLAEVDPEREPPDPPPVPEEIESLRFVEAEPLLGEWEAGRVEVPPILPPQLRVIRDATDAPLDELARRLVDTNALQERTHRIEFVPDVWMLPLRTETLPPASHTNAFLPGGDRFLIVDPGSAEPEEIDRLLRVVARRRQEGSVPEAVVLTHHHRDHSAGAAAVAARLGVPVRAHPLTFERTGRVDGAPNRPIEDGEALPLGALTAVVRHTPGHAPGHVVLEVPERRVVIAGDLISGVSTIVIPEPRGDMGAHLDSLRRVAEGDWRWVMPAHGPPVPPRRLREEIEHRLERHRRVLEVLESHPLPERVLAERAYADTPAAPIELTEMQTRAHLRLLERERKAVRAEGGWRRC